MVLTADTRPSVEQPTRAPRPQGFGKRARGTVLGLLEKIGNNGFGGERPTTWLTQSQLDEMNKNK